MKKYVAAFAALAIVGTAGVMYIDKNIDNDNSGEQTTASTTSYAQSGDSYTNNGVAVNNNTTAGSTEQSTTEAQEYSFYAEVSDVSGMNLILTVESGDGAVRPGDEISANFNNVKTVDSTGKLIKADDVANFKNVTVTYDGLIMETHPAQVDASKFVFSNRTDCNVYFCLPDGEVVDVVRVPVGSHLDSADMPNAGAYCEDGYHFEGWNLDGEKVFGVDNVKTSISLIAEIRKD